MESGRWAFALAVVVSLLLLGQAAGHGLMVHPRSRNWIAYTEWGFNYAHGLNALGVKAVSNNGAIQWPQGRRGLCGDGYNETRWDKPGSIQTVYRTGQNITIDVAVSVNHLGRFNMWLCPIDSKDEKACQRLVRTDGGGESWFMPYIPKWTGGNAGYDKPMYGDGFYSYYLMPSITPNKGCKGQLLCDMFRNMVVYRTTWQLPKGFACNHCKLQWQWLTGHSCWPPCPGGNKDFSCQNKQVYGNCGNKGTAYPEEFLNCADVKITDAARTDGSENSPIWGDIISQLHTGKWGNFKPVVMNDKGHKHRRMLQQ